MQAFTPDKRILREELQDKSSGSAGKESSAPMEEACQPSGISAFMKSPLTDKLIRRSPSKDEFWDALRSHYNYLMDDGLIASCREASSDLSYDDDEEITKAYCWSFTQFIEQFKRLHDMLHHLQTGKQDGSNESILEEHKKVAYLCKLFNEQGQKLSKRYPDMRDEVHRHLNLLNNKWEAVEQSINPNKPQPSKDGVFDEISNKMRCLRRWLKELENRLCPVATLSNWTLEKLEEKFIEQQALQKEIEAKGKYVSALLKLCERLEGNVNFGQHSVLVWDAERVERVAINLQHRWHTIWLKSLECHCVIEDLMCKLKAGSKDTILDRSFSEEPLKKYPRLGGGGCDYMVLENELGCKMNSETDIGDEDVFVDDHVVRKTNKWLQNCRKGISVSCGSKEGKTPTNDKGIMVGPTSITQLKAECNGNIGQFEIVQDVGYSSETSAHFSNDERLETSNMNSCSGDLSKDISEQCISEDMSSANLACSSDQKNSAHCLPVLIHQSPHKFYLAPDKYPSINLRKCQSLFEDKPCNLKYKEFKSVPNAFYKMTSIDPDSFEDAPVTKLLNDVDHSLMDQSHSSTLNSPGQSRNDIKDSVSSDCALSTKNAEQIAKNITIFEKFSPYKPNNLPNHSSPQNTLKIGKRGKKSVSQNILPKTFPHNEKHKKSARVREWLNMCGPGDLTSDDGLEIHDKEKGIWSSKLIVDSSCDASGEYTTTESDGERSAVSDEVNNSLSFSQSFTGSVETVVPALTEEVNVHSERAGSAEPSPCVRMRKKKRQTRDRPWSVTEVHQISFTSAVPHSTSEGALDTLSYSSQGCRQNESCSKKLCLEQPKLSLKDVSSSCPFPRTNHLSTRSYNSSHQSDSGSDRHLSSKKRNSADSKLSSSIEKSDHTDGKNFTEIPNSAERHSASSRSSSSTKISHSRQKRSLKSTPVENFVKTKHLSNSDGSSSENKTATQLLTEVSKVLASLKNGPVCTEDHSSVSDQVWDEYQDPPYLSEPYSEQTADEDQVKRLINFGDDYRAILGSHSDASSINAKSGYRKMHGKSRSRSALLLATDDGQDLAVFNSGSDSDTEDFHNILITSYRALQFVSSSVRENSGKENFSISSEYAELVATCQTNLCHLHAVYDELVMGHDLPSFSEEDLLKLHELIREWEVLQVKLLNLQRKDKELKPTTDVVAAAVVEVCNIMATLREKLSNIWCNASKASISFSSIGDLENNIQMLQTGLATLQEMKGTVLSVSARILGLIAESGDESVSPLRDSATKLYQQWEDVYELSSLQLTKLQSFQSQCQQCKGSDFQKCLETVLQWQQVHVGGTLPKSEILQKDNHPTAVAEVQVAGQHESLEEFDNPPKMSANCVVNGEQDELDAPLLNLYSSVMDLRADEYADASRTSDKTALPAAIMNTRSRLWRAIRAAVPIQFALVILYCVSCLMEPHCCENLNSFDFSIFPQLRHVQGPPPV